MLLIFRILSLCLILPILASSQGFTSLKYMLEQRKQEAKIYLPNIGIVGKNLEIEIQAPKAKSIILLASYQQGETLYMKQKLRLDQNYFELAKFDKDQAHFSLELKPEQAGKEIFFEALIDYGDEIKLASFFGPNAIYSNSNKVKIINPPKSNNNSAAMARSFIPGLQQPRY